ncbi:MAG: alpha/beta fold hydrolase [Candidatus Limnocylindria bacterium]
MSELTRLPAVEGAGRIRLKDGRTLGYAELGDPSGAPVFYFHGVPGVRVAFVGKPADYSKAGIRLVTVDRPGSGVSNRKADWSLLDWPEDVSQLADELGFRRFGIIAESGGGPFGLACAYRLADRLTGMVISSGAGLMDRPGARRGIKPLNRFVMEMLPRKRLSALLISTLGRLYLRWPDFTVDSLLCHDSPAADRELLVREDTRAATRRMLAYATGNGIGGLVDELALLVTPWGFDPQEIRIGIRFWHGDADNTVPLHQAEYLSSVIPGSSLVVCPGEGHLVMARHLPEILDALRQRAPSQAA